MIVTLNTEQLSAAQRPLLFLLLDLLTESPVRQADGTLLPYEDVVTALERDTVSLGTYIGLESASQFSCGPFSDSCTLMLQVEPKKYELGVRWFGDLLQRTEFTADRIRVCASKITNAVSQAKRKGNAVVSELLKAMYYRNDSNVRCSSMLRQHKYLSALLEQLDAGAQSPEPDLDAPAGAGAAKIIEQLDALRSIITRPQNMAVHVAADWKRMATMDVDLTGPWASLSGGQPPSTVDEKRLAVQFDYNLFKPAQLAAVQAAADAAAARRAEAAALIAAAEAAAAAEARAAAGETVEMDVGVPAAEVAQPDVAPESGEVLSAEVTQELAELSVETAVETIADADAVGAGHGTIVGLGCIESAFLYHATPSISSFTDPDLPALMLFLQYLTQLEGPLWRQIRGQGFAYGYNLMPRPNEGLLYFTLYRATNVVAAYKETAAIVAAQLRPDAVWDETLLASAKSSLIFEIIEREKSVGNLVVQALLGSFKGVPVGYNRQLVREVNDVQLADLQRVGEAYVAKLFGGDGVARTAIVCHPDKAADVAEAFGQ